MLDFIIKALLVIITFVLFIDFGFKKIDGDRSWHLNKKQFLCIIPIVILIGTMCIAVVPANTVGVKYSVFTGTSKNTLNEGIHLKMPFDTVYEIDTTVQERTVEGLSVQTADAQFMSMVINVKYQVSNKDAFKVYKGYKTLDALNQNIIANYAQSALSEVCTQYNIIDILGEKRNEVVQKTSELLAEMYTAEGVTLKGLTIKDMDAGEEIENAIKQEAVAKKEVETAEQNRLKAEKEAETKLIEAQGEANANAVKTSQLTKEILTEQWIEKWNGELPSVTDGNGVMIDMGSLE